MPTISGSCQTNANWSVLGHPPALSFKYPEHQADKPRAGFKVAKGLRFFIRKCFETALPCSSQFLLTVPFAERQPKLNRTRQQVSVDLIRHPLSMLVEVAFIAITLDNNKD
jgi:hypothetical protein